MAPFALWHIALETDSDKVYPELDALTMFTHRSKVAEVATRVHFDMLSHISHSRFDGREFADFAYWSARDHEQHLGETSKDTSRAISYLIDYPRPSKKDILDYTDAKGFYVPQTLAMAYGAFTAHNGQFAPSVYEAVNLGGDTDSTASIVAAMSAIKGIKREELPEDFYKIVRLNELQKLSNVLAESIENKRAAIGL